MASSKEDFGLRRQQRHAFKHMPSSMPRQMMISWMVMGRAPSPETKIKKGMEIIILVVMAIKTMMIIIVFLYNLSS